MDAHRFPSRRELEAHQLERLRALIAQVAAGNRFQIPRLRAAALEGGVEDLAQFFERVPFTTKQELARDQEQNPPYGTNLTFPLERYTRVHQTSSTTGRPLRWLDTPESWAGMCDTWQVVLRGAGVGAGDRILFAFSFGPFIGFWLGFEAAQRLGCLCIPGGPTDSVTRLHLMRANDVTVLCCTPTYAIRLGEVAREEGFDTAALPLHAVIVGGEPGGCVPATRARIQELWPGARVFDHYGMTEIGPVTYQLRDAPVNVVEVIESEYLVEVIDPATGAGLDPESDALGELVLTSLGRVGSPLLRYRTGDLVRPLASDVGGGAGCLRLDGGIRARADQMVVVRGVNVYPSAIEEIVRRAEGVAEYRVEVDKRGAMTEVRLLVEPTEGCADVEGLCAGLARELRVAYSLRVPVQAVGRGELPRFELKARRWVEVEGE